MKPRLVAGRIGLFSRMRACIVAKAAADLEPERRFSEAWTGWLARDLERRGNLAQLAEAEALTGYPEDPAPIASQGLVVFLEWAARQERRRRARSAV